MKEKTVRNKGGEKEESWGKREMSNTPQGTASALARFSVQSGHDKPVVTAKTEQNGERVTHQGKRKPFFSPDLHQAQRSQISHVKFIYLNFM